MGFNINSFKSAGLLYGGARPSLFDVVITTPAAVNFTVASAQKMQVLCRAASLPEFTVSPIEVPYFGRKIKVAGERSFSDWQVSVINDEDFSVRESFQAWSNQINSVISNLRDPNLIFDDAYKALMTVTQYSKDGSVINQINIVGAFPTNIGPIQLDWDNANSIEVFSVNFAYDYWEPVIEQPVNSNIKSSAIPFAGDL